jgi:hypothetical protein
MADLGKATFDVEADVSKFKQQITEGAQEAGKAVSGKKIDGPDVDMSKATKSVSTFGSTLRNIAIGAGAVQLFRGILGESQEAQKSLAQVNQVIKSTGGVAGVSAQDVENLADSLSKKSGVDDEVIASGEAVLLTFKNVKNEAGKGNDVFTQGTKAALDMSVALGTDLQGSVIQLGKALNDPIKGITALQRVGVSFTSSQKEQIKALVQSGDTLKAQKIILKEVQSEFGGAAEATATSVDKAKVAFGNFEEAIGTALAPAIQGAATAAGGLAGAFSNLPVGVQQATLGIAGVGGAALLAAPKIAEMASTASKIGAAFKDGGKIREFASSLGGLGPAAIAGAAGLGILTVGVSEITAIFATNAKSQQEAGRRAADYARAVTEGGKTSKQATKDYIVKDVFDQNADIFRHMHVNLGELTTAVLKGGDAWRDYKNKVIAGSEFKTTPEIAIQTLNKVGTALSEGKQKAKDAAKASDELGSAHKRTAASAADHAAAEKKAADAAKAVEDSYRKAADGLKAYYDAQTSTLSTTLDVKGALNDVGDSLFKNTTTLDQNTDAGRENLQNLIGFKDKAEAAAEAVGKQTGSSAQAAHAMQGYADTLTVTLTKAGFTKDQIKLLQTQMGLTPDQIATAFSTPGLFKADQDVRNHNNNVNKTPKKAATQVSAPGATVAAGQLAHTTLKAQEVDRQHPAVTVSAPAAAIVAGQLAHTTLKAQEVDRQHPAVKVSAPGAIPSASELTGVGRAAAGIPGSKHVDVSASDHATGVLQGIVGWFDRIPTSKTITVNAIQTFPSSLFAPRAAGGPVDAGQAYLVGERGPELFSPGRSGTIIPAGPTARMTSGGSTIAHVHVHLNGKIIAEEVGPLIAERELVYG